MPFLLRNNLWIAISATLLTFSSALPDAEAQNEILSGTLQFNYAFVAVTTVGEGSQLVPVDSNHHMRSGDKLKLYLEALSEGYYYLFHIGPSGVLQQIFPESQEKAKLPADQEITIPAGNKWLELDSHTGIEKFYLIASETRQEHLENLYQHYLNLKDKSAAHMSKNKIIDEINAIRRRNLSTNAERPVRIGGSFRGPGSAAAVSDIDIAQLASKVDTNGTYSRFFTIDHQ